MYQDFALFPHLTARQNILYGTRYHALSALDPMFQQEIKELLKTLHRDLGLTIIMVSHNFGEVLYLADRVALSHKGEIIQTGTTEKVFERPATPFAARFVGMSNLFEGKFLEERAYVGEEKVTVNLQARPGETASHVAIRPEEIVPLVPGTNGLANAMTGQVADIACHGFFFDVAVMVGEVKFTARWNRNQIREFGVETGGEIGIGFHAGSVHVL